MFVSLIPEIPVIDLITSLDYSKNNLVLSLNHGAVYTYSLSDSGNWENSSGISRITPIEVVKYYESQILCGSCEGEIIIISKNSQSRSLEQTYTQKIHTDLIKDIKVRFEYIYTCGIDNYINVLLIIKTFLYFHCKE